GCILRPAVACSGRRGMPCRHVRPQGGCLQTDAVPQGQPEQLRPPATNTRNPRMFKDRYGDVAASMQDHVVTLEIQRPPHNFFDHALIRDIADALRDIDETPDARVVMLCAQGKSFCAGANFAPGQASVLDSSTPRGRNPLYEEAVRLFSNKKPVIAAVQGAAIGGGFGLAVFADFRVARPDARFG